MAKKDGVQLLGSWASPYSNRVQMALNLKSVDYEFIEENFYSNKSDRLLKANPVYKQIPVLIHDEKPICESLVIIQYVDDVWTDHGPSILPSGPYDRAMARFWADYIDKKWFPMFKELEKEGETRAAIMAKIIEGVVLLEAAFVECSKGKEFFGGDNVGYVDVVLGSYLGWIKATELMLSGVKLFDEIKGPGLARWAEGFVSHDAAKDVVPEAQKLIEHYVMDILTMLEIAQWYQITLLPFNCPLRTKNVLKMK
ncbi:glutathione s-transferase u17 [Phtheirospermum japonicum]|uniref:glutathione transferase n=1 Tax=Phtheirospermum japonicum TaxID=374723 RepID=A0A830CBF9_9LAMI|nr:glutathione s-transferase u17 [Phtheirospermum japonicum]